MRNRFAHKLVVLVESDLQLSVALYRDSVPVFLIFFPVALVYLLVEVLVHAHSLPEPALMFPCILRPVRVLIDTPTFTFAFDPIALVTRAVLEQIDAFAVSEPQITLAHIDPIPVNVAPHSFLIPVFPVSIVNDAILVYVSAPPVPFVILIVPNVHFPDAIVISTEPFNISIVPFAFVSVPILIIECSESFPLSLSVCASVHLSVLVVVDAVAVSLVVPPCALVDVPVVEVVLAETVPQAALESAVVLASVVVLLLNWTHLVQSLVDKLGCQNVTCVLNV